MDTKTIIRQLGGPTKVGEMLGVTRQAVSQWKKIPLEHAVEIMVKTDMAWSLEELRPDISWPRKKAAT